MATQEMSTTKEAWECSVCYCDGTRTAQLRLGCSHNLCLECYIKMTTTRQGDFGRPDPRCPLCRAAIRTTTEPTVEERRDFDMIARNIRAGRNTIVELQRNIDRENQTITAATANLQRLTEPYGLWAEYEPRTQIGWRDPAATTVVRVTRPALRAAEEDDDDDDEAERFIGIPQPDPPQTNEDYRRGIFARHMSITLPIAYPQMNGLIMRYPRTRCPGCSGNRQQQVRTVTFLHESGRRRRWKRCDSCIMLLGQNHNYNTRKIHL